MPNVRCRNYYMTVASFIKANRILADKLFERSRVFDRKDSVMIAENSAIAGIYLKTLPSRHTRQHGPRGLVEPQRYGTGGIQRQFRMNNGTEKMT